MSKKKYSRNALYEGDFKLHYDEIRKAVNTFDKEFGIKLKDPEIWADPEGYLKVAVEIAKINISAAIVLINGILITDYFDANSMGDEMPMMPIGHRNPTFVNDSMLNWDKENSKYNTDSLIFRARFVSLVLESFMGELDDMVKNSVKCKTHSQVENAIVNLKRYMDYTILFVDLLLDTGSSYQNIILKIHELASYKYNKINYKKLKNSLNSSIVYTRKSMKSNIITESFYSDDMSIYELLKISYTLSTNSYDYNCLPSFKHIEGATRNHDLIKLIEELGSQVIRTNGKHKAPIMFKSFITASPSILTQYNKECYENLAIVTGIMALSYCDFVMDDRTVHKFISQMFKKGY